MSLPELGTKGNQGIRSEGVSSTLVVQNRPEFR
jgi:hypothetical protein